MDEVLSATAAAKPLAKILFDPTVDVNFPPLHNAVLYGVRHLLGSGDHLLRLPSVVAGALSVPLVVLVARHAVGRGPAVLAGLFVASSPFHVWYSQEARPYALLLLFGLLAAWCALRFVQSPERIGWLWAFVGAGAATCYTHIIAGPVLAALSLYLVAVAPGRARRKVVVAVVIFALLLVPQVMRFLSAPPTASANADYHLELSHVGYTFWAFATGYSLGPSLTELRGGTSALRPHLTLIMPVIGLFGVLGLVGLRRLWRDRRDGFWFVTAWVMVPVVGAAVGSLVTIHPYNVRYAILAAPGFLALCAAGCLAMPRRAAQRLFAVGVLLVQGIALVNYYTVPRYWREDNRAATRFLNEETAPGETVLVSARYTALPLEYYGLRADLTVLPYPPSGLATAERVAGDLAPVTADRRRLWVFLSRTFHSDPDGEIPRYLDKRMRRSEERTFPGVRVLLYTRSGAD